MRVEAYSIELIVEGTDDEIFLRWLLGKSATSRRIGFRECGGKRCQREIAKVISGKKALVISDRDFRFLTDSDFGNKFKNLLKELKNGVFVRKIDENSLEWNFTELENIYLRIFFELSEGKNLFEKDEVRDKLIAITMIRSLRTLLYEELEKIKDRLMEKVLSCANSKQILQVVEENPFLRSSAGEFAVERLKFFHKKLDSEREPSSFSAFLAGKKAVSFINKHYKGILSRVLSERGLYPSEVIPVAENCYKEGTNTFLDGLRSQLLDVM